MNLSQWCVKSLQVGSVCICVDFKLSHLSKISHWKNISEISKKKPIFTDIFKKGPLALWLRMEKKDKGAKQSDYTWKIELDLVMKNRSLKLPAYLKGIQSIILHIFLLCFSNILSSMSVWWQKAKHLDLILS